MDIETRQHIEDLQIRMRGIDSKISVLQEEIDSLNRERLAIMKEIQMNSDSQYEQTLLTQLYEQRKNKK